MSLIYTDGSKDVGRVASAAIVGDTTISIRISSESSILTAEIKAIILALQCNSKSPHNNYIICFDSLSVLN